MTKILILSDSHGLQDEISMIKNRHQVDYVIHCGDSELEMGDSVLEGILTVRGNCDFERGFPYHHVVTIDGITFFIAHGHLHDVNINLFKIAYEAKEHHAQIICYGHTHVAGTEKVENQLFINPGSIRLPRRRVEKTYAMIRWDNREKIYVEFYDLAGKNIAELSCITSL